MSSPTSAALTVRSYRDDDQPAVLALLDVTLGGGPAGRRPPEFFHWKHLVNPFGRSFMLLAEHEGQVVGFRSFMRWRLRVGEHRLSAVRAVDTATHPEFQGRGIFRTLTLRALDELREDTDLVFNTPNDQSRPGYLKMGWQPVGEVPVLVRVRRPFRFARNVRSRTSLGDLPGGAAPIVDAAPARAIDWSAMGSLAEGSGARDRIATAADAAFLRWRYADAPLLDYRVAEVRDADRLRAVAVFRVRPRGRLWETTIADVLHAPGDGAGGRAALRAAIHAARVDHVTASFSSGSVGAAVAHRLGCLPSPDRPLLVANALRPLDIDPFAMGNWALALGDVEVF